MDIDTQIKLLRELQKERVSKEWLEKLRNAFNPNVIGRDYTQKQRSTLEASVRELVKESEQLKEDIRQRRWAISKMDEALKLQPTHKHEFNDSPALIKRLPQYVRIVSGHIEGGGATPEMRAGVLEKLVHLSLRNEPMYAPSDNPLVRWLIQRNIVQYEPLEHRKVLKIWLW